MNDEKDLNSKNASLTEGLGDDAFDYDIDDATLPAENDSDETETGMAESDADDLRGMESMGDTVLTPEEEVESEE